MQALRRRGQEEREMTADKQDTPRCDICRGDGGWYRCFTCAPSTVDETDLS